MSRTGIAALLAFILLAGPPAFAQFGEPDEPPDSTIYEVVRNYERQHSCWPSNRGLAHGWERVGVSGTIQQCQDYIESLWLNMGLEACSNSCPYANDGECDDGGPGAQYAECTLGTDCADCGPRRGIRD